MEPYDMLIMEMLPGNTPREKYENLKKMGELLMIAGWVKRGTVEKQLTIIDIAERINSAFSLEEVERLCGE